MTMMVKLTQNTQRRRRIRQESPQKVRGRSATSALSATKVDDEIGHYQEDGNSGDRRHISLCYSSGDTKSDPGDIEDGFGDDCSS